MVALPKPAIALVSCMLVAAIVVLALAYVDHNWLYAADDSYITFRYADNLRAGYGLRFNIAERFYGTTAAGYALILWLLSYPVDAVLVLLGAPRSLGAGAAAIPIAATALSSLSLAGICVIALQLVRRYAPNPLGFILVALATLFAFVGVAGNRAAAHETYPFLALSLAGTYACLIAARPAAGAVLLALATCMRPDAGLVAGLTFCASLGDAVLSSARSDLRRALRPSLRFASLFAGLIVGWLVFVRLELGSVLPQTLVAKQAEMTLGVFDGFDVPHLAERLLSLGIGRVLLLAGAALLLALIAGLLRARDGEVPGHRRRLWLLAIAWLGFALGDSAIYLLLRVSLWDWYAIAILFALGFAIFAAAVSAAAAAWATPGRWAAAALVVALLLVGPVAMTHGTAGALGQWLGQRNVNGHLTSYQKAIDFIVRQSPEGATIAICEPGAFGFKLGPRYRIVDELGLISPGVAQAILRRDMDYPFRVWRPDYIVLSWHGAYSPEGRPWLGTDYEEVLAFSDPFFAANHLDSVRVLRRRDDRRPAAGSG